MKRFPLALLALAVALAITPAALADSVIYQATTNNNNGLNFGPVAPQIHRQLVYWEMGNTITFAGSASTIRLV